MLDVQQNQIAENNFPYEIFGTYLSLTLAINRFTFEKIGKKSTIHFVEFY